MEEIKVPTDTEVDTIIASGDTGAENCVRLGYYIGHALGGGELKNLPSQVRERIGAILRFLNI